ncbi:MAG: DUF3263 domain-containing protein [Pseudoclavibacter sp.]
MVHDTNSLSAIPELTQLERDVLAFEAAHPRHSPAKEDAIRRRFDRSSAQYYQILATLIEAPAALARDPLVVARLRRRRDARTAERDERRAQRRSSEASGRTKAR